MSAANEHLRDLPSERWDWLERQVKRFEEAWQHGQRPALEAFLPAAEGRRELLIELALIELEYRFKAGEPARVEDYLARFPELARDRAVTLHLIVREHELRRRREPALTADEYVRRFPQYRDELTARLEAALTSQAGSEGDTLAELERFNPPPPPTPAPPIDSSAALGRILRHGRLLRGGQLEELDRLQTAFPEPRALARQLVQRNWLTPFQVNKVFQGRAGELTLGPYVLLERLGEGGMGTVFKARHQLMDRIVALKVIRKEKLSGPDAIQRFQREMRAAARLQHPNIVMAYDADQVGDTHFLVLEYVEGTDLGKLVIKEGPLPVARACAYVLQAALGLQHAFERGLVHRDVKPGNLLLSGEGIVKVMDLGLARLGKAGGEQTVGELTHEGMVMGSPDYIAPEQAQEAHAVDIRADIYALGCTLYHLLTGRVPFPEGSFTQKVLRHMIEEAPLAGSLRPEVPPALSAVVLKMMAKRPEGRYQTPAQVAEALAPFAGTAPALPGGPPRAVPVVVVVPPGGPVTPSPVSTASPPVTPGLANGPGRGGRLAAAWAFVRRHPRAVAGAVGGGLLLIVLVWLLWLWAA
ncbi:MAG: serine/threonine protein kinase [Gemmataceae bacterium]|nr:serine/threonine protein kinase [Gemmataceae bacterium]